MDLKKKTQEYEMLLEKLALLKEKRVVLEERERQKREQKKTLEKELKAHGIDTSKVNEELARLEKEIDQHMEEASRMVDNFEVELLKLEGEG